MGKAIALEFARLGANLALADVDLKETELVVKEIKKMGRAALAFKCDISKAGDVDKMFRSVAAKFKRLDIMINNAGILLSKPFAEMSEKDWDKILNVNLKGVFLCSNRAAKVMIKQKSGKIVSIASIAGKIGFPGLSAYGASKAGIINLTKVMALELASYNINVNAIAPGAIDTPMAAGSAEDRETLSGIPLGRIGKPEEIAKAAAFLASDDANYITGHTLVVDGGWTAK